MILNGIFLYETITIAPSSIHINLAKPNETYCFTHFKTLEENFGFYFLVFTFVASFHVIVMVFHFSEILCSVLYYQAGCMIENVELELKNRLEQVKDQNPFHSRNQNAYQILWKKYEAIHRLVKRTDQLFGFILVSNQFTSTFLISFGLYRLVFPYGDYFIQEAFAKLMSFSLKTAFISWLTTWLKSSGDELKNTLAGLLSEKWLQLSVEDRKLLVFILNRLQKDNLAACPLNLYTIDRTFMLSLAALIVSYVIILVQSTWVELKQ